MWTAFRRRQRTRLIERLVRLVVTGTPLLATAANGSVVSLERLERKGDPVVYRQVIAEGRNLLRTNYLAASDAAASFVRQIGEERALSVVSRRAGVQPNRQLRAIVLSDGK